MNGYCVGVVNIWNFWAVLHLIHHLYIEVTRKQKCKWWTKVKRLNTNINDQNIFHTSFLKLMFTSVKNETSVKWSIPGPRHGLEPTLNCRSSANHHSHYCPTIRSNGICPMGALTSEMDSLFAYDQQRLENIITDHSQVVLETYPLSWTLVNIKFYLWCGLQWSSAFQ